MDYITIIKGDDTNFLEDQFIVVNFKTDFPMSGFTATFTLDDVTLTYGNLSEKKLEIILSKEITSNLKIGKQYGELKLIDTQNRIRTITSVIPFLVKNGVNEQITYINNALNITTNINDTTIEIIVETAGIAKTEAEKILSGCNEASQIAQNSSNTAQTLALRMDEQVSVFTARQNALNTAVINAVNMCEQNLEDMEEAEETALTNISNATANLADTVQTGLTNINNAKNSALSDINGAISELDNTISDGLDDISTAQTNALNAINANKTSAILDITSSKSTALSDITTAKTSAGSAITSAKNNALSAISSAENNAEILINKGLDDLDTELSKVDTGISNINVAKANALSEIETSKNEAIEDISDLAGADLTVFALSSDLADVATSGNYNDLINKPVIPSVPSNVSAFNNDAGYLTQHQDISGKANSSDLARVATTGSYNDLTNKPVIPNIPSNVSAFTNDAGYLTSHQDISGKANTTDLATVATSGKYNDLIGKPAYISSFTNDMGYVTSQDVGNTISNYGTMDIVEIDLGDNIAFTTMSMFCDISLPGVSASDKNKLQRITLQIYMPSVVSIDLGTSHFFNQQTPDMSKTGYYNIFYEFDLTINAWVCYVSKKS